MAYLLLCTNAANIPVPCFELRLEISCLPYCFQRRIWLAVIGLDQPCGIFVDLATEWW